MILRYHKLSSSCFLNNDIAEKNRQNLNKQSTIEVLEVKLAQMNQHQDEYSQIYVQVYCTLLAKSETSGFIKPNPSTQDRERAVSIAKLAGVHTDQIVEYLMTNFSRELQSAARYSVDLVQR